MPGFLGSLARQSIQNFEVILVDGGSLDGSLEVAQAYQGLLDLRIVTEHRHNIGACRNVGAAASKGEILLHTNTDVSFHDPHTLYRLLDRMEDSAVLSVGATTTEREASPMVHALYWGFHILRWIFSRLPDPMRKYRPTANFIAIRRLGFIDSGGFPEALINEDGRYGAVLDTYSRQRGLRCLYCFDLRISHYPKRFSKMGLWSAATYYLYVIPNMFPVMSGLFKSRLVRSSQVFHRREYVDELVCPGPEVKAE